MTLIIAGFERAKDPWAGAWGKSRVGSDELKTFGLFAVADSLITSNSGGSARPLLSGLRKIHPIPIKLWKPYIVNGIFRDYLEVHSETECFVAFAGSTLTSTHVLDVITEHLAMLRISFERIDKGGVASSYVVKRDCEYINPRDTNEYIEWGEDMFLSSDFEGLLTGDYLADVIEHSINVGLKSARKYRLDATDFKLMAADFLAGIQCPATNRYRLFTFRMDFRINDEGVLEVFANRKEISEDEVAVLGMRKEFESRAQLVYSEALKRGKSTGESLFNFLNTAIDEVAFSSHVSIDRPSVHKFFERGSLSKVGFKK